MSEPVITLIGGPTALIEANGFRVLTDPTFDAPGEYQLPHVTLKKVAGPARTAEQIGQVDAVLLSHDQAYAMARPAYSRRWLAHTDLAPPPQDWHRGKTQRSASKMNRVLQPSRILVTLLSRSTSNCVLIARPGDHPGRKVYLDHIFRRTDWRL